MATDSWAGFLPPLVALLASYVAVSFAKAWLPRFGVLDRPNARSSHRIPTPRGGGVGIVVGVLAGLAIEAALDVFTMIVHTSVLESSAVAGVLVAGGLVGLAGLVDDVRPQPAGVRLVAQGVAALLVVLIVGTLDALRLPLLGEVRLGMLAGPITIVWLIAVTNIFNFMDGIDGLAAGQAAIAGVCLALGGVVVGNSPVAIVGGCLAAASLGFLVHNFPPARIFMGDVGSTFLGFTFAGLAVLGAQAGPARISIYVSALLVAPFLFDATLTLLARIWRGERWYEAHRSHLYQRLVRAGHSHRRVSLLYYLLALVLGGLGLVEVATGQGATDAFLLLGVVPLLMLVLYVRRVESEERARGVRVAQS